MSHARPIGYGAMLGEGSLAVASTMAAVAGIGLVGACNLTGQGEVHDLSWAVYYSDWASAGANKAQAFVLGGGQFLQEVGLPGALAQTLMAVLVISFAATTLDTATRIERLLIAELGAALRVKVLCNPYVATVFAIGPALALAFLSVSDPATGQQTQAGWVLWPIFGASNQMLAALTLMVVALYFWRRGRPVLPLVLPMLFVMGITFASLLLKIAEFYRSSNWLLFGLSACLLALILWMILEGLRAVAALRAGRVDPR
jgi:carbon starvation protein